MRRRGRLAAGIVALALGLVAVIAGAALLATFGADGAYEARSRLATRAHAIVFDSLSLGAMPFDEVTLEVAAMSADEPVFVGIADAEAVARGLDDVALERIVRIDPEGPFGVEEVAGDRAPGPPGGLAPWVASGTGARGTQTALTWTLTPGAWALVIMNVDGSAGVDVTLSARLTVPGSGPAGIALTAAGVAMLVAGAALTISSSRPPRA